MQYLIHPLGGVCFPSPHWPVPQWPATLGRTGRRFAAKARRYAANTAKLITYTATGTGTGFAGLTAGLSPAEAISLGLNAAGTAAAFWPLSPLPPLRAARAGTESGAVTDASN
ncbi:hypothetical protein OG233_30565 [Streptomyces sp. NBC_01218]|uniref:hypothetical protein n=1 Tax=Streptomyces sp. NBC_01218 TaxID=2903780 RepID=UPI002E12E07B|nr:hypothetical protein OG233_00085 [Streptomyces sp. NBC_01218]WSQ55144.1 hypothetical protein OG233_30565 [Streptomyces sp. NBC_01218]